jgi:hypothetical protein
MSYIVCSVHMHVVYSRCIANICFTHFVDVFFHCFVHYLSFVAYVAANFPKKCCKEWGIYCISFLLCVQNVATFCKIVHIPQETYFNDVAYT